MNTMGFRKIFLKILYYLNKEKFFRRTGLKIGNNCRLIGVGKGTFGTEPYLIEIGDRVTVTKRVQFITHDGSVHLIRHSKPDADLFGSIVVGDNCFIGFGSIILQGTKVADNVIIGAGSVVKGVLEADSVYAGVPAKRICSVDEYFQKNESNFTYIRSKGADYKKKYLIEKFMK